VSERDDEIDYLLDQERLLGFGLALKKAADLVRDEALRQRPLIRQKILNRLADRIMELGL
jgi:hypothetical protein